MLVLRLSAIGDVAMTAHAIRALRNTYPELDITICTRAHLAAFYDGIENLDFLFFPKKAGRKELFEYINKAKEIGFDYVADIQNNLRTVIIRNAMRVSGAHVASYDGMGYRKWKIKRRFFKDLAPIRNNVLRFCDVFAKLGFPVPEPQVVRRKMIIPEAFGKKTCTWVGVAPFSRKRKKIYPLDKMAKVVASLSERYGRVFLFSGPGEEKEYCDKFAEKYSNVESVFGRTNFAGETALISNLDAVITMDSAAMHMASLTGAPFLTLWGGTHPATGYSAYGCDWQRNYLQLDLPCRPCSNYGEGTCRMGDFRCMEWIKVEEVLKKVDALVNETS